MSSTTPPESGSLAVSPLPELRLDAATLGDLDADLAREWLVTNGLGGYAMGSICGTTTRAYHGLLVAAVHPPVGRVMLVTKVDETVIVPGRPSVELGTNEYADGTISPRGFERLTGFVLEGLVPCFTYRLDDGAEIEKRVWMEHGANVTFVRYSYRADAGAGLSARAIVVTLAPFCLDRDHHGCTRGSPDWRFLVDAEPSACTVRAFAGAMAYRLIAGPAARFDPRGEWYWNIFHRAEHARGLVDTEDVYLPGTFSVSLAPGATATLVLCAEPILPDQLSELGGERHEAMVDAALARERQRETMLLDHAGIAGRDNELRARLTLAADQFLVARSGSVNSTLPMRSTLSQREKGGGEESLTVIAGYPWFTDWGRDTMIALPGLTLTTRRVGEARGLLLTFARYLDQGMLPNRFPDAGEAPEYNTVDATLWYFHAIARYLETSADNDLLAALFPRLDEVIEWHTRGTRYGIHMDPADGLLAAGAPGAQLTWMDAKVDDWVVTPRWGKPVEVNALWHHALALMGDWARRLGRDPSRYDRLREDVERSFAPRFWYEAGGYLYDVVDVAGVEGASDWALRPNQLFALALAPGLVAHERAVSVLRRVETELLTPLGVRTLSPEDPRYIGSYGGDRRTRDGAYHQGTVWPWLLGAYADACVNVYGTTAAVRPMLAPFAMHLREAGIGSVSEVASGSAPYTPGGCVAQAWSVAELLRLAALLETTD